MHVELRFTTWAGEPETSHVWIFVGYVEDDEKLLWLEDLIQGGEGYRYVGIEEVPPEVREEIEEMGFDLQME